MVAFCGVIWCSFGFMISRQALLKTKGDSEKNEQKFLPFSARATQKKHTWKIYTIFLVTYIYIYIHVLFIQACGCFASHFQSTCCSSQEPQCETTLDTLDTLDGEILSQSAASGKRR